MEIVLILSFPFFIGKPLFPLPKILHCITGASKLFGVPLHTIRLPQKFTVLTHDGKLSWSVGGGGKKWELLNYFLSSRILCADERLSDFPAKVGFNKAFPTTANSVDLLKKESTFQAKTWPKNAKIVLTKFRDKKAHMKFSKFIEIENLHLFA